MNDFYIGWSKELPESNYKTIVKVILGLGFLMPVAAVIFAVYQGYFNNGIFEFEKKRAITGVIYKHPIPVIVLNGSSRQLLLVGCGKMGGLEAISQLEEKYNKPLSGIPVKATGKLIYHNSKTAFELEDVQPADNSTVIPSPVPVVLGEITLRGEITDPKCLLGVMKPGQGITHRECAIRCIAGGISPALKVENRSGESEYYLLVASDGKPLNNHLLPFIGIGVEVTGRLEQHGDWLVYFITPDKIKKLNILTLNAPMCN